MRWMYIFIGAFVGFCAGYFMHGLMGASCEASGVEVVASVGEVRDESRSPNAEMEVNTKREIGSFPVAETPNIEQLEGGEPISVDEFRALAEKNVLEAVSILATLTDEDLQQRLSGELVTFWTENEPYKAYLWVEQNKDMLAPMDQGYYETMVILNLAKHDPDTASGIINQISDPERRDLYLLGLATGFVKKNPDEAFDWLESLAHSGATPETLNDCYETIMHEYMRTNPVEAAKAIEKLASESQQAEMAQAIIGQMAEKSLDDALLWAQSLRYPKAHLWAMEELLYSTPAENMEILFSHIVESAEVSQENVEFLQKAFSHIADKDPDLSLSQFQQLPAVVQVDVATSMLTSMLNNNQEKAEQWLLAQPKGPLFSAGAVAAAKHYSMVDLDLAIQWGSKVEDAEQSKQLIRGVIKHAGRSDLPSIQKTLDRVQLAPQIRTELEAELDRRVRDKFSPLVLPTNQ